MRKSVLLTALFGLTLSPAVAADGIEAANVVQKMRSNPHFQRCELNVWVFPQEIFATLSSSDESDKGLNALCTEATNFLTTQFKLTKVNVICSNARVSVKASVSDKIRVNDSAPLVEVVDGFSATSPLVAASSVPLGGHVNSLQSWAGDFAASESRVAANIQLLKAKNIGVKPYSEELAKIHKMFQQGDIKSNAEIERLDESVRDQLALVTAREQARVTSARPNPAIQKASGHQLVQEGINRASFDDIIKKFSSNSGSASYESMAQVILEKELGELAPSRGPFRVERFRIARKIKQLQSEGTNVSGVTSLYKKLEESVRTNRVRDARDQVLYLQQQLSLN